MTELNELLPAKEQSYMASKGLVEWVYANDSKNPFLKALLNMFYEGVDANSLGIMVVKNALTDQEETILVGLVTEDTPDGAYFAPIPLAKVLNKEEAVNLLAPDGEGGYIDHRDKE